MEKAIRSPNQRPALDDALVASGPAKLETHARLARATNVLVHRIGDDERSSDALGASAPPQRARALPGQTKSAAGAEAKRGAPYQGTITPARSADVRPPYRPPVALRLASLRAREVQPPLLNMGTATGFQVDDREKEASGWRNH